MHSNTLFTCLLAVAPLAIGIPTIETSNFDSLRLIKTSPSDPGQLVQSADLFDRFTSKGINFVDITDIKDTEVLAILSGAAPAPKAAVPIYPAKVQHTEEAYCLIDKFNTDGPKSWMKTLTDFFNRHYLSPTGTEASNWIFAKVKELAVPNPEITVKQFFHKYNQPSIIATIPGNSSNLVIVGAHLDSTAGGAAKRSPGADDNASGTVTIMEAFRLFVEAEEKPQNTLEFHWYSGEEAGLLGSKDVFAAYKEQSKTVVGMLQQDMTGYSPTRRPGVILDFVDSGLTRFVFQITSEYTGTEPIATACGYGCSDHASATSNGFPAANVFEDEVRNANPNIHKASDSMEVIQWDIVERHIKLTIGFIVELSHVNLGITE